MSNKTINVFFLLEDANSQNVPESIPSLLYFLLFVFFHLALFLYLSCLDLYIGLFFNSIHFFAFNFVVFYVFCK